MKKSSKNILKSVIPIATAGFVSYKIIKKKYPDKVDNINKKIKDGLLKFKNNNEKIEDISIDNYNINYKNYKTKDTTSKDLKANKKNISKETIEFKDTSKETIEFKDTSKETIEFKDTSKETIEFKDTSKETIEFEDTSKETIEFEDTSKETIKFEDTSKETIEAKNIEISNNDYIKTLEDLEKAKENIQKHLDSVINENVENLILPDNYIEDEIRYQLCLSNKEPITKSILQKLERIDFFEINDNDLDVYCDFLAKYTNIKSIVIDALNPLKHENIEASSNYKNCLKNISPINNLSSLEELSFNWGIGSIDFSSLTSLNKLKKLEIKFGMLENIDFLKNLENLEHIEVMLSNNVKDLSVLTNLKKLKRMYIYTNINLDINILKTMPNLKYLYINGESISL